MLITLYVSVCVCSCTRVYHIASLSPKTTCKGQFDVGHEILFNGWGEEARFGGSAIMRLGEKGPWQRPEDLFLQYDNTQRWMHGMVRIQDLETHQQETWLPSGGRVSEPNANRPTCTPWREAQLSMEQSRDVSSVSFERKPLWIMFLHQHAFGTGHHWQN